MASRENKKFLKIGCALMMCFFSLFSVATAALAWFWTNHHLTSGWMTSPDNEDLNVDFFVYKYDKTQLKGTDLNEDTVEDETDKLDIRQFSLKTYDTIFTFENDYTPALIRAHFYGSDLPVPASGETQTLNINIHRDITKVDSTVELTDLSNLSSLPQGEEIIDISYYKFITSGVDFKALFDSSCNTLGNSMTAEEISALFLSKVEYFKKNTTVTNNFVKDSSIAGVKEKPEFISLPVSYDSVYTDSDGINHINLFIYVDYNRELIEKFTKVDISKGGNFLTQIDTPLTNDLTYIDISVDND